MRPKIVRIAKTLLQKICLNSLFWMYWAASTWAPTFSSIKWHFDLFYSSLLHFFFFRLSKSDSSVFRVRVGWNKNETFCRLLSKYFPRWRCNWESTTGNKMATKAQMVDKWPVTRMNFRIFTKTQSVNQKYSEIFLNVIFCDFQFKLSMKHQIHI